MESGMNNESRQVRFPQLLCYGLGDLYGGGSFLIIGMLFMFYLTEVVGLSPLIAGFVFAIGKVWDAVSDPLMGYISDRTRTRFGRRRIYFLIGIAPIAVTFTLMWVPVGFSSQWTLFAYYSLAYICFSTVFTMVMVPYAALNAEMSHDYNIRTRLSGARIVFSNIATLLGGTLASKIAYQWSDNPATGFLLMAVSFATLFSLPWIVVFLGTWELPFDEKKQERGGPLSIFSQFRTIFRNKSFRIHIAMYVCAYSAIDILMALFAYYMTFYIGKPRAIPIAMGSMILTQTFAIAFYVFLSNRRGKAFSYKLGLSIWLFGLACTYFLNSQSPVWLIAIICSLIGFGMAAGVMIPWAMLPTIIDVDELITAEQRSGVYSGAMTLMRKFVQGLIAMPTIGFVLGAIGFVSKQESHSIEVLEKLKSFLFFGPGVLIVLGFMVAFLFKVTPAVHTMIVEETKRLKSGGEKNTVANDIKNICEEVTGIDYENLYVSRVVVK